MLTSNIGDVIFQKPFMNASGVYCTTFDDLYALSQSNTGGMMSKSCKYLCYKGHRLISKAD